MLLAASRCTTQIEAKSSQHQSEKRTKIIRLMLCQRVAELPTQEEFKLT